MTHSHVIWLIHTWHAPARMRHDSFIRVTWLIHLCDMTHSYVIPRFRMVSHALIRDTPQPMCDTSHSCVCVTWPFHMWHDSSIHNMTYPCWMTRLYVTSPSFHVACLIHMFDMTHSCMTWHIHVLCDAFIRDTPQVLCDISHSYVWHDSFICDMTYPRVEWRIYTWHTSGFMWHVPFIHSNISRSKSLEEFDAHELLLLTN